MLRIKELIEVNIVIEVALAEYKNWETKLYVTFIILIVFETFPLNFGEG